MDNNTVNFDKVESAELLHLDYSGVHWGYWVLWVLLCWPVVALVAMCHYYKKHNPRYVTLVRYSESSEMLGLEKSEYDTLNDILTKKR